MPRTVTFFIVLLLLGALGFGGLQFVRNRELEREVSALRQSRDRLEREFKERSRRSGGPEAAPASDIAPTDAAGAAASAIEADPVSPAASAATGLARTFPADGRRGLDLLNSPEVQQLMALQQKAGLDGRYAALFKRLNLNPADLEKFKNLLVEKQAVIGDVMAAARSQGLRGSDSRDEIRVLVEDAQAQVDDSIRTTLGEAVYSQYKNFEATMPQRAVVDQLTRRLSYSPAPLTETQGEQLVQILATAGGAPTSGSRRSAPAGGLIGSAGRGVQITNEAIVQAQGVLTPVQVSALESLKQEQQAGARLMEQLRANRQNPQRVNTAPTPPAGR